MRFRLHKLLDAPVGTRQVERLERGSIWLDEELHVAFLKGDLVFVRANDRIVLEAEFTTATTVQCVRSLEMFELPLAFKIDDLAFRLPGLTPADDTTARKLPPDLWVDLKEDVREAVVIAIPISPVHPDYRDEKALGKLLATDDESEKWLTVKWARKDDDQ